ncbi:MAG: alpha/beta fold hydrolase [Candidatus Cloacimonetes bacterium]|nr:alpha/beta fold hydrolase [Candidatus Cloacimonadota bacterium]
MLLIIVSLILVMQFLAKKRDQVLALNQVEYDLVQKREGNKQCILMLHGFGVTPQMFLELQKHLESYDCYAPILTGSSCSLKSFTDSKSQDWITIACDSYDELTKSYEQVVVLGFSMGGLLAYHLTQLRQIDRCIILAPYFGLYKVPSFFEQILMSLFENINLYIKNKSLDCSKSLKKGEVFTYGFTPTKAVSQLIKLSYLVKSLPQSKSSILVIHSQSDHVADFTKSKAFLNKSEHVKFVSFEKSYHYILHDVDKVNVYNEITTYLKERD